MADVWDRHGIDFLGICGGLFAHELRECARLAMWSQAAGRRKDMQGLGTGVDVEATVQLLRELHRFLPASSALSLLELLPLGIAFKRPP